MSFYARLINRHGIERRCRSRQIGLQEMRESCTARAVQIQELRSLISRHARERSGSFAVAADHEVFEGRPIPSLQFRQIEKVLIGILSDRLHE